MPLASEHCVVLDEQGARARVAFPWDKQAPCVREVVRDCISFRISVVCASDMVVRAVLDVDDASLASELRLQRHLRGEVHMVGLLAGSWRDMTVVSSPPPQASSSSSSPLEPPTTRMSPRLRATSAYPPPPLASPTPEACLVLMPHQLESVAWMRELEEATSEPLLYEGNLRLGEEWFVNTEDERLTVDPSWRESHVRGGVLADWPGAGKTVTMLHHCARRVATQDASRLVARGTLIVLPLNLHAQWLHEAQTFFPELRVLSMASSKDMRAAGMCDLLCADVVLTTFPFLRSSKPYHDMVEDAVVEALPTVARRDARCKTAVSMWARLPDRIEPVLEAVHWHRVVVDEVHETFAAVRNVKALHGLRSTFCWGISATPSLDPDAVPELYNWLLQREKAYHPNLMMHIERRCVRVVTCPDVPAYERQLRLIPASEGERRDIESERDVETIVKVCTRVHATDDVEVWDEDDLVRQHSHAIGGAHLAAEVEALRLRLPELDEGSAEWREVDVARADAERELASACGKLDFVKERIRTLATQAERCPICDSAVCGVILLCGHTFCRQCIARHAQAHNSCPMCRTEFRMQDVRGLVLVGAKVRSIADALCDLAEPVIVFAQWKATLRTMRAVLRGRGLRSFTLDGNGAQRVRSLHEFAKGGVLLLSLNDSFAGLHLPHVRHVVFAHAVVGCQESIERLEKQAIARCLRHGQTRRVYVHSFVIAESAEEELWRMTHPDESDA